MEPILLGLVVGLVPVTIIGLLVAAYLQFKGGNPSGLNEK
ncbi:MAG: cytochrome b6-f complex subunit 5 [Anaerolineae bacterium]|jgi:cytochrome b6-f complex subunit 5|nr:cytochrome b6-f complex subunit 5 [Gloeobacterales cyanobacterium ES-bin-313]